MAAAPHSPLSGLTVVAIEQAVAMPYCTSRLADAGARVIKIERPEGDFARGYDCVAAGQSSYFVWLNRGKESMVCDFKHAEDRDHLHQLVAHADVFVQNLKPGSLDKLGFAVGTLRQRNPELICCSISGYGDAGPLANRKAYDMLVQAESGLASLTGSPEAPARVGISMVDIATGATAHAAILEALFARSRGCGGADIRVSMFDVMADWLTVPLLHSEAGSIPGRNGLSHPSIAPYGLFSTADGHAVVLAIQNDREWETLCQHVLRRPDMIRDPSYCSNIARVNNRLDTDAAVSAAFKKQRLADLTALLDAEQIAFAQVNDMMDLSKHPHLRRITGETPNGPVHDPAPGATFCGIRREYGAVPAVGENRLKSDPIIR